MSLDSISRVSRATRNWEARSTWLERANRIAWIVMEACSPNDVAGVPWLYKVSCRLNKIRCSHQVSYDFWYKKKQFGKKKELNEFADWMKILFECLLCSTNWSAQIDYNSNQLSKITWICIMYMIMPLLSNHVSDNIILNHIQLLTDVNHMCYCCCSGRETDQL